MCRQAHRGRPLLSIAGWHRQPDAEADSVVVLLFSNGSPRTPLDANRNCSALSGTLRHSAVHKSRATRGLPVPATQPDLNPSPISRASALVPNWAPRADSRIYRFLALQCPSRNLQRTIRASRRTERRRAVLVPPPKPTSDSIRWPLSSRGTRQHLRSSLSPTTDAAPRTIPETPMSSRCGSAPNVARDLAPLSCIG